MAEGFERREWITLPSELTVASGSQFDLMSLSQGERDHLVKRLAVGRPCGRTVITPRSASMKSWVQLRTSLFRGASKTGLNLVGAVRSIPLYAVFFVFTQICLLKSSNLKICTLILMLRPRSAITCDPRLQLIYCRSEFELVQVHRLPMVYHRSNGDQVVTRNQGDFSKTRYDVATIGVSVG